MTDFDRITAYTQKRRTYRRIARVAFGTNLGLLLISLFLKGPLKDRVVLGLLVPLLVWVALEIYLRRTPCPGCGQRLIGSPLVTGDTPEQPDPFIFCPRCKPPRSDAWS